MGFVKINKDSGEYKRLSSFLKCIKEHELTMYFKIFFAVIFYFGLIASPALIYVLTDEPLWMFLYLIVAPVGAYLLSKMGEV